MTSRARVSRIGVTKLGNEYARVLSAKFYEQAPKAVLAAIAVSFASQGGDWLENAENLIRHEWWALYENGIVLQKPPFPDVEVEGR